MNRYLFIIIFVSCLIFSPALFNFFSSDDWFHLHVVQISSISQFFNFFSFIRNAQTISFYRPISTQLFFFTFNRLFGLQALPYYIFILIFFGLSLFLIHKFIFKLTHHNKIALATTLLYGISVTNFTRIYFLSAFQEICMVNFVLLTILTYLNNKKILSIIFFLLALGSKETAVITPILLFLVDWYRSKINLMKLFPHLIVLILFLFLRLHFFGNAIGDSYVWNFSPTKIANTISWYIIWSFGAPEVLLNYVQQGMILPAWFHDFPFWSYAIVIELLITIVLFLLALFISWHKRPKLYFFAGSVFVSALLPVIFLPLHKYNLELGLPLIGFVLIFAAATNTRSLVSFLSLIFFISLNLTANLFVYRYFYTYEIARAKISRRIYQYISSHYPTIPAGKSFYFANDYKTQDVVRGISKQIAFAVHFSDLFKVYYHNPNIVVYYEDIPSQLPNKINLIELPSSKFLKN